MKNVIRITESQLKKLIKEAVSKVIDEGWPGIDDVPDTDDLNRMALSKGFKYIGYHNSEDDDLTFFDVRTSGIHFGSEMAANERGETRDDDSYTKKYFLKIVNPYVAEKDFDWESESLMCCGDEVSMDDEEYEEWRKEYDPAYYLSQNGFDEMVYDENGNVLYAKTIEEMLSEKGYDCIIYKNQIEDKGNYSVAMFNPNNIKLAETTYDNGKEIPLEKRFDTTTDDVRY